jgi:hypothetical protein
VDSTNSSNDDRAVEVEQFILTEAVAAGVVRKIELKAPRNPNKWGKTLSPWFNETCREAKREMARERRVHGNGDKRSLQATRVYHKACHVARMEFAK